jgi:hypothetical protein
MTKKEYKSDPDKPSEMFEDSLEWGIGSADMECGWCGRLHLCPENDYDPPDYVGLEGDEEACRESFKKYCLEEHKENPEGVILHWDSDSVLGRSLNGINFVIGCPCNGLSRFEKFIWNERNAIRNYLKKRIDYEFQLAEQEKTLNKLAGIA